MTPREKILRDAIAEINYNFEMQSELTFSEGRIQDDLLTAIQKADAVKDGPSEEDMERLKEILGQHRAVKKYTDTENLRGVAYELINDLNWVGDKLKQYMDIK